MVRRYERCKVCKENWNISIEAKIPKSGYVCPKCRMKSEKKRKK